MHKAKERNVLINFQSTDKADQQLKRFLLPLLMLLLLKKKKIMTKKRLSTKNKKQKKKSHSGRNVDKEEEEEDDADDDDEKERYNSLCFQNLHENLSLLFIQWKSFNERKNCDEGVSFAFDSGKATNLHIIIIIILLYLMQVQCK